MNDPLFERAQADIKALDEEIRERLSKRVKLVLFLRAYGIEAAPMPMAPPPPPNVKITRFSDPAEGPFTISPPLSTFPLFKRSNPCRCVGAAE